MFEGECGSKLEKLDNFGASHPFCTTIRYNKYRSGCAAVPWPAVGAVWRMRKSGFCFILVSVADILAQGIAFPDFDSYMATSHGETFLEQRAVWLECPEESVLSVPWGWLVLPYIYCDDAKKGCKKMILRRRIGVCCGACPCLSRSILSSLSPNVHWGSLQ